MAKIFNYVGVTVGIWIMLFILGETNSGSFIATQLGFTSADSLVGFQGSIFWANMIKAFGAVTVGAVIIGVFTKTISALPATAALSVALMVVVISDIGFIINQIDDLWIKNIMFMFLAPYTVGYIIALWDWTRGMD